MGKSKLAQQVKSRDQRDRKPHSDKHRPSQHFPLVDEIDVADKLQSRRQFQESHGDLHRVHPVSTTGQRLQPGRKQCKEEEGSGKDRSKGRDTKHRPQQISVQSRHHDSPYEGDRTSEGG